MNNFISTIPHDHLYTIFWKAPNPIGISTAKDGVYIAVNEAFTKLYGMRRQQVIGKSSVELGFLSKEKRLKMFNEVKEKGCAQNILVKCRNKSNELQCVLLNTTPIKIKNQMLWHTIGTNISNVKLIRELQRENILARSLDSLDTIGVILFNDYENEPLSLFHVNETAKKILGKETIPDLINELNGNESIFLSTKKGYYFVRQISTRRNAPMKIVAMEKFPSTKIVEGQIRQRGMTPRQQEIAMLVATGYSNSEIAEKLCITRHTVKDHLKKIFLIFDVHNRVEIGPKILSWR